MIKRKIGRNQRNNLWETNVINKDRLWKGLSKYPTYLIEPKLLNIIRLLREKTSLGVSSTAIAFGSYTISNPFPYIIIGSNRSLMESFGM